MSASDGGANQPSVTADSRLALIPDIFDAWKRALLDSG
jgi:hypothetical protein